MDNHKRRVREFALEHLGRVEELVEPLQRCFGLTSFGYRRFLPDGTSLGLCNNREWIDLYFDHFLGEIVLNYDHEISRVSVGQESMFFRTGVPGDGDHFKQALYDNNTWNSLALYIKNGTHIDGFYFESTRDNADIINFYLNNKDLLRLFAIHFSQKVSPIMEDPEVRSLYQKTISKASYRPQNPAFDSKGLESSLQSLRIDDLQLQVAERRVSISFREFQCLFLMSRGQTFKEIGKILDLSPRTIESYINNLKSKTNTNSKSELIGLYFESPYRDLAFGVFERGCPNKGYVKKKLSSV